MWSKMKLPVIILMAVVLLIVGYLGFRTADIYLTIHDDTLSNQHNSDNSENNWKPVGDEEEGEILNTLLIGVDTEDGSGRSDTIMLARYNKDTNEVGLVSIPRDTRVKLPGRDLEKINHAHAYGGPSYLVKTVQEFLDIPVHHYVRVNMNGFENAVNILGGVELAVEQDMYYATSEGVEIDIDAGRQTMDGEKALEYVRWRSGSEGDIGRARRQQKFIAAALDELLQFSSVTKINSLLEETADNVKMTYNLKDIMNHASSFHKIKWDQMETKVLPGESKKIDDIWYYIVDEQEARKAVKELVDQDEEDLRSVQSP